MHKQLNGQHLSVTFYKLRDILVSRLVGEKIRPIWFTYLSLNSRLYIAMKLCMNV